MAKQAKGGVKRPGFPPVTTVQCYFYAWCDDGVWRTINHYLLMMIRQAEGREASPSASVVDSQSVKTTESGGPRGYDAGKKIKGRKALLSEVEERHIVTDTQGFCVAAMVHTADIQDRDGAPDVLASIGHRFPWLRHVLADSGYAGDKLRMALDKIGKWTIEIIKRSDTAKGFEVLPRRWVVERRFADGGYGPRISCIFRCASLSFRWRSSQGFLRVHLPSARPSSTVD